MDRNELFLVNVPEATVSYAPVAHRHLVETIDEELYRRNIRIAQERFSTAREGKQLIGYMDIKYQENEDLGMRIAFRNSYDKSMSAALVAGSVVWICSNGMVSGEMQFLRKHTGTVAQELKENTIITIEELENHFKRMQEHSAKMKEIQIEKQLAAELCGRMFIEEDVITSTQLNIIKRELENPTYPVFEEPSLWSFYNHVTHSLKEAHPTRYIKDHVALHDFVEQEFELV